MNSTILYLVIPLRLNIFSGISIQETKYIWYIRLNYTIRDNTNLEELREDLAYLRGQLSGGADDEAPDIMFPQGRGQPVIGRN